jgi:glutamine synthetase
MIIVLGANEAPPAIISVFIGQYLTKVLEEVKERVSKKMDETDESMLKLTFTKAYLNCF